MIFCKSGPEKRSIGSDFSATRHDLGKRRKTVSPNVLNFMLPRLQRLGPSERRAVPVQRSDFAEKLCFLALGSQERSNRTVWRPRKGRQRPNEDNRNRTGSDIECHTRPGRMPLRLPSFFFFFFLQHLVCAVFFFRSWFSMRDSSNHTYTWSVTMCSCSLFFRAQFSQAFFVKASSFVVASTSALSPFGSIVTRQ